MDGLRRRIFLVGTGAVLARTGAAAAEQRVSLHSIGYIALNSARIGHDVLVAFRSALSESGWIDGRTIVIETRFGDGDVDRLPKLISELLSLKVDLIVATSSATARACKSATTTVPVVMLASANALGEGLVASLARPGGNITGMTLLAGPESPASNSSCCTRSLRLPLVSPS